MKSRRWDWQSGWISSALEEIQDDFGPLADADDISMDALEDCENMDLVDVAEIPERYHGGRIMNTVDVRIYQRFGDRISILKGFVTLNIANLTIDFLIRILSSNF